VVVSEEPNTPQHSVSVAAAVVDADRVLVVRRRDNGRWEPPGGVLELGESIPDGLRREVREETGLTVEPDALTGVYKNLARGVVALVFRCHATGGVLKATAEAGDFRWLQRDDLAALVTPAYAVRLTDALDYAGTPAVRAHNGTQVIAEL
jgi:8-oxo-dGTP diphosphatase